MPWCDDCARFYNPTSLKTDGTCPSCGHQVAEPVATPWHFKLLLVAIALYLGWRFVQGVMWVAGRV